MALSANTVLEVRTTGSDTNGGGFVTGSSGTDWSQQDAAQYSVTDGVTAGTTTITSATAAFGTDVVGNLIYVQGGTGSVTAGWYQIVSRTNATTIVVDRSTGLTAGTGVTLKIGGALATPATALSVMTASGMICYFKSGTYSVGTGLSSRTTEGLNAPLRYVGYNATRNDDPAAGSQPVFKATAGITILTIGTRGHQFENITFDGDNITSAQGCNNNALYTTILNCVFKNCKGTYALQLNQGGAAAVGCELTGNSSTTAALLCNQNNQQVVGCNIHDNTTTGASLAATITFVDNLVTNNTGASSDGVLLGSGNSYNELIRNNTIHGNGRDGIRWSGNSYLSTQRIQNNVITSNGGYGINLTSAPGGPAYQPAIYNNAFRSNTSGARNNFAAGPNDVTLTGDPFTNAAGGDFSLNNTAGAGAACRAAGYPGAFPGGTTTGYADIGAAQHQDSGGGGSTGGFVIGG